MDPFSSCEMTILEYARSAHKIMLSSWTTTTASTRTIELKTPPGAKLTHNFVSPKEASDLFAFIDRQPWDDTCLKRRVQHYGYKYDYSGLSTAKPVETTPIPSDLEKLVTRLLDYGLFAERKAPDQIIVNEYKPGQGIGAHVDHVKHFEDTVATLSLGSMYQMDLSPLKQESGSRPISLSLPVGSLLVLSGESRYDWTHSIAARKSDPHPRPGGKRTPRGTRISVTFRRVRG